MESAENLPHAPLPVRTATEQLTWHPVRTHTLSSSSSHNDESDNGDSGVGEVNCSPFKMLNATSLQLYCTAKEGEEELKQAEEEEAVKEEEEEDKRNKNKNKKKHEEREKEE